MSYVTRVLTNPAGTRVTGVEYYDDKKERQVQEAGVVVLADLCVAQSAPVVQLARPTSIPNGLANRSGLVGKYAMAHGSATIAAIFRRGRAELHGLGGLRLRHLRPPSQDHPQGCLRLDLLEHHRGDEAERRPRHRRCAAAICSAASSTSS